uniref:Uncharacterized protein n=1 Tax=Avena sativa TaxID=4498 RepID=A0ACD5TXY1_AVESA
MAGSGDQARQRDGAVGGSRTPPPSAARSRSPSRSPPPRPRGRSRTVRRGREVVPAVVQRTIRDSGSAQWPMLTKTNYGDWAVLMQVMMESRYIWDAVDHGEVEHHEDRMAMEAILRAVPPEMICTLAAKPSAKAAWDAIKTMRLGSERVRQARRQSWMKEFENIEFKSGESVDDFSMRIGGLVANLKSVGGKVDEEDAVCKFLRVVPPKYSQIALSTETLVDLSTLSIEDLTGRITAAESRYEKDVAGGSLLLTEEEWMARAKLREQGEGSTRPKSSDKGGGKSGDKRQNKDGKKKGDASKDGSSSGGRGPSSGKGACHNCGIVGHYARDCRKPRKERKQEAHLTQASEEQPALLMAVCVGLTQIADAQSHEQVFLNEEKVIPNTSAPDVWYLDTGASNHMTGDRRMFTALDETVTGTIKFGDGSVVEICGKGSVMFMYKNKGHRVLTEVYLIPRLRSNIISIGQLDEIRCKTVVEDGMMCIFDPERLLLAKVRRSPNRLYRLPLETTSPVCLLAKGDDAAWRWHARFGHLHFRALHDLAAKDMVTGLPVINREQQLCDGCAIAKMHRTPFPRASSYRAEQGLELVHGDLCGPISPATPSGNRYFLLIVDDYSRFMWVEMLRTKDEAFRLFRKIKALAESERQVKLRASGAIAQNGVVERRNQSVVEMARSLLKSMKVPARFWGEAVKTAVHILNRAPTRALSGVTPYEAWHGRRPDVSYLRTFGCTVFVKKVGPCVTKLSDRETPMVFVGYEDGSKAYRVYDPSAHKLHITRDAAFDEGRPWSWDSAPADSTTAVTHAAPSSFTVEYEVSTASDDNDDSPAGDAGKSIVTPATRRAPSAAPTPVPATPTGPVFVTPPTDESHDSEGVTLRYRKHQELLDTTEPCELEYSGLCLVAAEEPASVELALKEACWKQAMDEELSSIRDNQTWELADLPPGQRAIGLKWVFKVKKDPQGNVIKHKARLVAKGYAQRQGVNFDEVFAPVARMETVRVLIALAAHDGWEVHHMDVKSAFLNGDLAEEVYVRQPPGFVDDDNEHMVLKLRKALYGLRQAPRAWNSKLDSSLVELGFERSPLEHAVYRRAKEGALLLVGVYVDDLIITGSRTADIVEFKEQMMKMYSMSDLGLLSYYLGIEVNQTAEAITLCQSSYARNIVELMGMESCNPCQTPMENRLKLTKNDGSVAVDPTEYRSIVRSLRYLVNTRPDIGFAVGIVSRYMEAPTSQHMAAVKHIIRYVSGTGGHGCRYERHGSLEPKLVGYTDSDLAGDADDRKSTSGMAFFLGSSCVTWASQKQKIVALSSCEAEYIAAATAACQGVWLSRLIGELSGRAPTEVKLLIDNKSAIALCKNPVHHDRSKHIDTRYHFIRECVEEKKIDVQHVRTEEQIADILTKSLGRVKFVEFREKLGVVDVKKGCHD